MDCQLPGDNLAPMSAMPREIDRANPANALIISDETLYFNNTPGTWRRITASCPDSDEIYITLTNQTEKASAAGRTLPVRLYQALYRPTKVSLQFIRWLRAGLMRPTCYRQAVEQLRPLMLAYL